MKQIFLASLALVISLGAAYWLCCGRGQQTQNVSTAAEINAVTNAALSAPPDTDLPTNNGDNALLADAAQTAPHSQEPQTNQESAAVDNKNEEPAKAQAPEAQKVTASKGSKTATTNKKSKEVSAKTKRIAVAQNKQESETPEMAVLPETMSVEPEAERATAPAPATPTNASNMVFEETMHEFGIIQTGKVVEHEFKFVNKGNAPLVIYDASSSCGCTIPEYPQEPIMPGQGGAIKVTYDSKGKIGTQNKIVTLKTSAGEKQIRMSGVVLTENLMKKNE